MENKITKIIFGMIVLLTITQLVAAASWEGYVKDSNTDAVISGATISIYLLDNTFLNSTLTDGTGRFVIFIPDASGSTYMITSSINYQNDTSMNLPDISSDFTLPFNTTLIQNLPGTLSGKITGLSLNDIENANISLYQNGNLVYSNLTDSDGEYSIPGILDGTYNVTISATGYISSTQTNIVISPSQTTDLSVSLNPTTKSLSGYVTDLDTSLAVSGASVRIVGPNTYTTTTNTTGYYSISGIIEGTYTISVSKNKYKINSSINLSLINETNEQDILLKGTGTFSGAINVDGATITVSGTGYATTSSNYTYTLSNIPLGSYDITASKSGYNSQTLSANISTLGEIVGVSFNLVSSSASFGGGSSGGGGVYCTTEWNCTEWSECANGTQTRVCSYPSNFCKPLENKPVESKKCGEDIDEDDEDSEEEKEDKGIGNILTGFTIANILSSPVKSSLAIIIVIVIGGALYIVIQRRKTLSKEKGSKKTKRNSKNK